MADTLLAPRSDPAIATCLYADAAMPDALQTSVAVLRAELDQARGELRRIETLLESKHQSQTDRALDHERRLGVIEQRLVSLLGRDGVSDSDGGGMVGSHARQLRKIWPRLEAATVERWRLAAYLAASSGLGAGGVKLLEILTGGG